MIVETGTVASLSWELARVDRWLTLWASYERRDTLGRVLHPLEKIRLLHDGVSFCDPVPEPAWVGLLDEEFRALPLEHRAVLKTWYFDSGRKHQKAARLGVSIARLYTMREAALNFIYRGVRHRLGDFPA